jgi:hypothetical protein
MTKRKLQVVLAERGKRKANGRYDVQIRVNDKIKVILKDMAKDEASFAYGNIRRAWQAAGLEYTTGKVRYWDDSYNPAKVKPKKTKVKKKS